MYIIPKYIYSMNTLITTTWTSVELSDSEGIIFLNMYRNYHWVRRVTCNVGRWWHYVSGLIIIYGIASQ
jgi:hypothetical protein